MFESQPLRPTLFSSARWSIVLDAGLTGLAPDVSEAPFLTIVVPGALLDSVPFSFLLATDGVPSALLLAFESDVAVTFVPKPRWRMREP